MNNNNRNNEVRFDENGCSGVLINQGSGGILVTGYVNSKTSNPTISYWAANPPTYGTSFSGSGLPYPNPEIAYNRTSNAGTVMAENRRFAFRLKYPNAYYVGLGTLYIPPHVNIKVSEPGSEDVKLTVKIDEGIPFRTLTYPAPPSKKPRISPMFYYEPEKEVRTQEQILRDSAYPSVNRMPDNFWGLKPPV